MSNLKSLARDWFPPAVMRWIQNRRNGGLRFEGEFANWDAACAHCTGYDTEDILAKVLAATLQVKHGAAAFERDSVLFEKSEYEWPVVAGLMMVAARNNGALNVLDFGGSLGSTYFQNLRLLNTLPRVQWSVIEQRHFVKAGKAYIQDEKLRFYCSIQECLTENKPNVILLSSVLQYLSEPSGVFLSLLNVGADSVILDRTSINCSTSDRIYVQHVPASIYSASYPCRSFSESGLLAAAHGEYRLSADFQSLPFPALERVGSSYKGYIFSKGATQ